MATRRPSNQTPHSAGWLEEFSQRARDEDMSQEYLALLISQVQFELILDANRKLPCIKELRLMVQAFGVLTKKGAELDKEAYDNAIVGLQAARQALTDRYTQQVHELA